MKEFVRVMLFCGLVFSSVEAQSIYVGIGGGFSTLNPRDNYGFSYTSDRTSWPGTFEEMTGRHADVGFNITTSLEFQLPNTPVSITTALLYTQLYGKCDYVKAYTPPWYSAIYTIGELTTRSNILTFKTGAQYEILPAPFTPYVSLGLLYSIIGDTKLSINNTYGSAEAMVEGNTRLGLSLGGGVRVLISSPLEVDIGAEHSWINLVTPESEEQTEGLTSLREIIREQAPLAQEKLSYQMPAFFLNGPLVYFAAYVKHIGFYPTSSGISAFKSKITKYKNSKGAVQFPIEEPLPKGLIKQMVRFRVTENMSKGKR